MSHYRSSSKLSQPNYEEDDYGEEDDLDDDDVDGYDCLSDCDEDIEFGDDSLDKNNSYGSIHNSCSSKSNNLRRHRSISEGSPHVMEHSDDNRRDHHNHLERKRRASIKGSYNDLREAIPSLRGSKASRAVTLQRAVEYIEELTKCNQEHTMCVDTLTRQNDALDRQVQDISRSFQRMEEDEFSAINAPGRNLLPTAFSPPESCPNGGGINIRFIATTASSTAFNPVSTNSRSSTASPIVGSNVGFPVIRVIPQNGSPLAEQPITSQACGLTQLSCVASQLQQSSNLSVTKIPSSETNRESSFASTPSTESVKCVSTESQPNETQTTSSSTGLCNPTSAVKPFRSASSAVVIAPISVNNRRTATLTHYNSISPHVPENSSSEMPRQIEVVNEESVRSTTVARSFPLETAVLKARTNGRGVMPMRTTIMPSGVPIIQPSSHTPVYTSSTAPRRVVIVSAQEPQINSTLQ